MESVLETEERTGLHPASRNMVEQAALGIRTAETETERGNELRTKGDQQIGL